jgi:glycosyltransferase involved in cell wall biosynthesis
VKIGFHPGEEKSRKWGKTIHPWVTLVTDAIIAEGCELHFLTPDELRSGRFPADLDLVHVNWPQRLVDPSPRGLRKYLPYSVNHRHVLRQVDGLLGRFQAAGLPMVWQIHDMPCSTDASEEALITDMFRRFFAAAAALLFYEASAQAPIYEILGHPDGKVVGFAPLGDYCKLHGDRVPREAARARLGIAAEPRMFLYAGKVRDARDPSDFVQAFIAHSSERDVLHVVGRGVYRLAEKYPHDRVIYNSDYVGHDEFRDLFCAADFVVNDAARYLGSAVIRAALGYGVPVITRSFGCTADLAADAYLEITDKADSLAQTIQRASGMSSSEWQLMSEAALLRHAERPWSAYAKGCISVYEQLISKR